VAASTLRTKRHAKEKQLEAGALRVNWMRGRSHPTSAFTRSHGGWSGKRRMLPNLKSADLVWLVAQGPFSRAE